MTRLKSDDIFYIAAELDEYDAELLAKTGCTLRGIACCSAGIEEKKIQNLIESVSIGIVPISSGQGVIEGFSDTVKQIVAHIGFKSFTTKKIDVAGIAEAFEKKSDIIMIADDDSFVAINVKYRRIVDNTEATAKGYVSGLNLMTGGLKGKNVLVIGCGPVGKCAAVALVKMGCPVSVYDINRRLSHDLAKLIKRSLNKEIIVERELNQALSEHRYIIDASPAVNIIDEQHISKETYICAPGVPHGMCAAALKKIGDHTLIDPLRIGVAVMAVSAAKDL